MKYLVDSSVLINLIIGNTSNLNISKNFLVKNNGDFSMSNLTQIEFVNVISGRTKNLDKVIRSIQLIQELDFEVLPVTVEVLTLATKISVEVNDSVYDCSYHALAIIHDLTFVTFDKKYYQKAKHLGNIKLF